MPAMVSERAQQTEEKDRWKLSKPLIENKI